MPNKTRKLLIFPYNGNGLEAACCLPREYKLLGFVDDQQDKLGRQGNGHVVFTRKALLDNPDALVLAVPGSPASFQRRAEIINGLGVAPERFATVISPDASVSPLARVGRNVLLMPGVVVTGNAVIGDHVCVLPNSVIHHDCEIGDWTLIGSNVTVAGYAKIGASCYIGSGTSVINNISIGERTLVGIGSNVIRPLPAGSKAVGNPARILC